MCGIRSFDSVPTCSGWGLFTHGAFLSAQDDDTRGRKGSYLGDTLRVLELAVLYTIRVAPYYENLSRVKNGAKSTPFIILY